MMRRFPGSVGLASVVLLVSLQASAASAPVETDSSLVRRIVSYRTLDLSRGEGVAKLYSRIRAAAESVCWTVSVEQLSSSVRARQCESEAIARAVAAVNAPALTNLHETKRRIVVALH